MLFDTDLILKKFVKNIMCVYNIKSRVKSREKTVYYG